jgi:hypothetical protein
MPYKTHTAASLRAAHPQPSHSTRWLPSVSAASPHESHRAVPRLLKTWGLMLGGSLLRWAEMTRLASCSSRVCRTAAGFVLGFGAAMGFLCMFDAQHSMGWGAQPCFILNSLMVRRIHSIYRIFKVKHATALQHGHGTHRGLCGWCWPLPCKEAIAARSFRKRLYERSNHWVLQPKQAGTAHAGRTGCYCCCRGLAAAACVCRCCCPVQLLPSSCGGGASDCCTAVRRDPASGRTGGTHAA